MGRVERRKQDRINKKNKINDIDNINNDTDLKKGLIVVLIIVVLLVLLYFFVAIFVTKEIDLSKKKDAEETTSSESNNISNKILASNIFNQSEETYFVYFYDFSNEDENISQVVNSINDVVYKVDTSSGLNSKYIVEDNSNKNAKNLSDLKIKSPTLIKISNDTITEYYEENEILSYN